jgi:hypothetical protein
LIIALIVVVVAVAMLLISSVLGGSLLGGTTSTVSNGLSTQVSVQDAKGKDVTDKVSVASSVQRPDTLADDDQVISLTTAWIGKRAVNTPVIITVTDSSFTNDDGLAVYTYTNYEWQLIGTYLIVNHSVSFQADELTSFAFQVISSQPEPTPSPTPAPTPEPTPEPVVEVVDYGDYDEVQDGLFIQTNTMALNGSYVIAVITGDDAEDSDVTFFDANSTDDDQITARVLLNYSGQELRTVDAEVGKTADGRYYMIDDVVDGMLWTAVASDTVKSAERFSLENHEKFLNLDEDNENVVMDENNERTRWLYETVDVEDGDDFNTLTYVVSPDTYYSEVLEMVAQALNESEAEGADADNKQVLQFTMTDDQDKAITVVLFQLSSSEETVSTDVFTGTLVLTSTPSALDDLEATPRPTSTPDTAGATNGLTPSTGSNNNSNNNTNNSNNNNNNNNNNTTTTVPTAVPATTQPSEQPIVTPPTDTGSTNTGTGSAGTSSDASSGTTGGSTGTGGNNAEEPAT